LRIGLVRLAYKAFAGSEIVAQPVVKRKFRTVRKWNICSVR